MPKIMHQTPPGFERVLLSGRKRILYNPGIRVRAVHARFMRQVEEHPLHFIDAGKGVMSHIQKEHRYFFSTDLVSAFDHVTAKRLTGALAWRGIRLGWLTPREYFFHEMGSGGLIQGAPSSPYLFETYCRFGGLDRDLMEYCDKLGFHYTRYIDDILISSSRPLGRRIGPKVRTIVDKYGFSLSDRKTKRVDVRSEPLEVLGFVIRGNRIDPSDGTMQKLFENDLPEQSRTGVFRWRRQVRELNKRR